MATEVDPDSWQGHRMQGGVPPPWLSSLGATLSSLAQRSLPAEPGVDKDQSSVPQTQPATPPELPSPLTQVASQQPQEPPQETAQGLPLPTRGIPTTTFSPTGMTAMAGSVPAISPQLEQPKPAPPPAPPRENVHTNIQREAPFQSFVPNAVANPAADWRAWGKDHWRRKAQEVYPDIGNGPNAPSYDESFGIIRGAGQQLGTWGAPAVAIPARIASGIANTIGYAMDYYSHGAFGKAYDQATAKRVALRREEYELGRQRMLDANDDAVKAQLRIENSYHSIMSQYEAGGFGGGAEGYRAAQDALHDEAQKHGDQALLSVIENSGLKGAQTHINNMHATTMDTWQAGTAQRTRDRRSQTKQDDEIDSWSTKRGGGGGAAIQPITQESEPPGQEKEGIGDKPEPPLSAADKSIADEYGQTEQGMRAAHQIAWKGSPTGMTDTQAGKKHKNYDDTVAAASEISSNIDNIANNDKLTPEQKIEKIRAIDKNIANEVDALRKYKMNPVDVGKNRERMTSLAAAVDKNYSSANYSIVKDMSDISKPTGKILFRVNNASSGAKQIADALKYFPETEKIPFRQMAEKISSYWDGDQKYAKLYAALRTFATEANAITGLGQVRVTLIDNLLKHMKQTSSPEQIRAQVQVEMQAGQSGVDFIRHAWKQATGTDTEPPLLQKEVMNTYRAYMHMNSKTGELPEGAPLEVMSTSKSGKNRTDLTEEERRPPIPLSERKPLRLWAEENRNNPDPKVQLRVRDIVNRLGIGGD